MSSSSRESRQTRSSRGPAESSYEEVERRRSSASVGVAAVDVSYIDAERLRSAGVSLAGVATSTALPIERRALSGVGCASFSDSARPDPSRSVSVGEMSEKWLRMFSVEMFSSSYCAITRLIAVCVKKYCSLSLA